MKVFAAGATGILALIVLATAIASSGSVGASGLSAALAGAPPGLVAVAFQAGQATSIDTNVLLALAKIETNWGQAATPSLTTWCPTTSGRRSTPRRWRRAARPRRCSG